MGRESEKILFLIISFLIFSLSPLCDKANANFTENIRIITFNTKREYDGNDGSIHQIESTASYSKTDPEVFYYNFYYPLINPFFSYPFIVAHDKVTYRNSILYDQVYHTGIFGQRLMIKKPVVNHPHLVFGGDSNMFGLGISDEESLPNLISQNQNTYNVFNLGFPGTGPNNLLYLLNNFDLKKIIGNERKGIFIYDFHHHLINRIIGSKSWTRYIIDSPQYILKHGKVAFNGSFSNNWTSWFYKLLLLIPFNDILIPDLPRIGHIHLELTAKVLAEIKKEYLSQTDSANRFIITFNPAFIYNAEMNRNLIYLSECLKKEGIEFIMFDKNEILPLPLIEHDGHLNAVAQKNYAKMILHKLSTILK
jgi:hypothetical protein